MGMMAINPSTGRARLIPKYATRIASVAAMTRPTLRTWLAANSSVIRAMRASPPVTVTSPPAPPQSDSISSIISWRASLSSTATGI